MTGFHYPRTRRLWQVALAVLVADQLTKAWAVYALGPWKDRPLPGYLWEYFTAFSLGGGSLVSQAFGPFDAQTAPLWDPWLGFRMLLNTGVSWSILAGNSFALSAISFAIAIAAYWLWWRHFRTGPRIVHVFGLIIGGALGNGLDRFRLREVVDFVAIQVPYIGRVFPKLGDPYRFPIFNLADVCGFAGFVGLTGFLLWLVKVYLATPKQLAPLAVTSSPAAFPEGLRLDDEKLEDLQFLDTTALKPVEMSMAERVRLQEEVSRAYVERVRAEAEASQIPGLASDLTKHSSLRRLDQYDKHIADKQFKEPL